MLAFDGRKRSLNSFSATQSKRWCSTVSSRYPQSGQVAVFLTFIRFKWLFNGTCLVLKRKIMVWSSLLSFLIGSLCFGLFMWAYMGLPVVPVAQLFIHSPWRLDLIIWQVVSYVTGFFG